MKRGTRAQVALSLLLVLSAIGQSASTVSIAESSDKSAEAQATADSLYREATAAQQQGDLERAEKYFRQSLIVSEKVDPRSLAVAQSLNGLGGVARDRGMLPEAEDYFQKALAMIQKLDPSGADAANSLDGLAWVANERSEATKSDEYALQAFAIRQKLDSGGLQFGLGLSNVALVYVYGKQWDKAEELYKQALSIQERLAPESMVLAETLSNLGGLFLRRQRYEEATASHQRALMIRKKIAPEGLAVADSLRSLGLCARNNLEERERYYRAALAIQERLAPGSVHVGRTLTMLSQLEEARGDMIAAETHGRQALAIWQKQAPGSTQYRGLLIFLGDVHSWLGDLNGAEEFARKSLEENRKIDPAGRGVVGSLFILGNVAIERGDLVPAENYYREALEISEKVDPGGLLPARMIRGLGIIAEARGNMAKADDYYRRALAIWERIEPGGNNFAQGLLTVGMIAHDRGNLAEARRYYEQALAIWQKNVPDTIFVSQCLGQLGQLAQDERDLAKAEEYDRRAVAINEKRVPGSPELAQGLSDLGDVLLAEGELPEALKYHQQALAIREKLLQDTGFHAASLAALGSIMRRMNKPDAAAQYYEQALDALENQTARLGSGDELRAGFRAKHATYYKDYIDLLAGQKRFEAAFQVLERFRARTLLETLAVARAEIHKGADPKLLQQQSGLQQALAAKNHRRIQLLGSKNPDAALEALNREIRDLHLQYQQVEDQIRASSPGYSALMHPRPISVKEIQAQLLDENTVLLEYLLGEERSYAWVLTRSSLTTYELAKRSDIEEVAREVYQLLTARGEAHSPENAIQEQARLERAEQVYRNKSAALSHMILGPLAGEIEQKKRLLIVSDGALQYIPFAALPAPKRTPSDLKVPAVPLLMKHEVVNLPSASVLLALRQPIRDKKPSKEIAVLADPVFAKDDVRVGGGQRGSSKLLRSPVREASGLPPDASEQFTRVVADVPSATRGGAYLDRLLYSRREARAILSLVPRSKSMQALDFQASRATALSPEMANYRVIHFATHGLLDSEHPELSGLVFSLVNSRGEPENGFLGLEDVYNMNLGADLVVLSACKTGLGREIQGEGLIGLTQGFMYAGTPQVIASLWSVEDATTAELMGRFYKAMEQKNMSPVAALRQAQLELLREKRWHHPFYWAGFIIQGERR